EHLGSAFRPTAVPRVGFPILFPALGAFWIMAKMVRRTCAFCSEGEAGSVMYVATERDIAAHRDCLLFSSGFVESEDHNPENLEIRFDVASVLKELRRGKRLVCNFCRKKGATVGCEERACRRSYHFFCALCDDAAVETDQVNGVYRYLTKRLLLLPASGGCQQEGLHCVGFKGFLGKEISPPLLNWVDRVKADKHRRAANTVQDFVRKCKQAGLLDDIFEEMLDTLHLAQEKLMDDNTSERGMFLGDPWGLCCQRRGADLNPRHFALGHLPDDTMVLNNSALSYFCSCVGG
uniref:PHD finger protein 11 n=1 Tax=Malurus cyaneus samueli TaxID=2593467 RepID=A0A8C5X5V6_9PASS